MNICNKCGQIVDPRNDAARLEILFHEVQGSSPPFITGHRHLFPIVEGGEVLCEGSPSRRQYLEGQPRDTRKGYEKKYNPHLEKPYRDAYKKMLDERH